MSEHIRAALDQAHSTLSSFMSDQNNIDAISKATDTLVECFKNEGRVYSCGNGGSMCDSMHFAEELTGRFRKDRKPLPAQSMGDPGHMTCVSNDFGYEHIFSRIVEAFGKQPDTLLAISTSGNSQNIINAVEVAKSKGMKVIALLGKDGGKLKDLVDVPIIVPTQFTERIQEIHIKIIHILIEGIERKIFPEHYA